MNNNVLISAGVMRTYWERSHRDTLDLIMPFLKCSIYETTKHDSEIKIDALAKYFREEYGYADIPLHVISVMLKRLSPSIVTIKNQKYYFTGDIDKEVEDFNKKKLTNKEHEEKVIEALGKHLSSAFPREEFTSKQVEDLLYAFFASNGLCLAKNTDNLIGLKQKDKPKEYETARFIMDEYHKNSSVFDYIYAMVQGFFVSTALYLPQASTSLQAKLRGVSCYIDTRIIINALGMHLPQQVEKSANEFLKMLKDAGANLYCFRHNYDEIERVLNAYKYSLANAGHPSTNTLEAFDEMSYSARDIDEYLLRLSKRIEALGISIVETPEYNNSYKKAAYIDVKGLEETFRRENENGHKSPIASQTDAESAAAIMLLRNGNRPLELEKAKYLFITSSNRYCYIVEHFLNPQNSNVVPVAYSERDMAALLWLRNYTAHKDYPKGKLIENAMLTLDVPSPQFLSDFFRNIDFLKSQGELTEDEAAVLRTDFYSRKTLLHDTRGNSDDMSSSSLLAARDRLKEQYLDEENGKAQLNYSKYVAQKEENDELKKKAVKEIQRIGDEAFQHKRKQLSVSANVARGVVTVLVIWCFASGITYSSWPQIVTGIILLAVDAVGFIDLLQSKNVAVSRWIYNESRKAGDEAMDRKRAEYEKIFGSIADN